MRVTESSGKGKDGWVLYMLAFESEQENSSEQIGKILGEKETISWEKRRVLLLTVSQVL